MTLDEKELHGGAQVFCRKIGPTGKPYWQLGTVIDINEHVQAVKLAITTAKRTRHRWVTKSDLAWRVPATP